MLTAEQTAAVRRWLDEGAGLDEVQSRLKDEFGLSMTYMDVRFLVLDIGAEVKDKELPKAAEKPAAPAGAADGSFASPAGSGPDDGVATEDEDFTNAPQGADGDVADEAPSADGDASAGKVSVSLDKVVQVGAMMSGTVTFSDGVVGNWMLDRFGRLALTKVSQPGYQPSDADLAAFQMELQSKLSGY